jgi:hypothetical protein
MKQRMAVVMLVALASSMAAQQPAAEQKKLAFEVASIKLAAPDAVRNQGDADQPESSAHRQHDADGADLCRIR